MLGLVAIKQRVLELVQAEATNACVSLGSPTWLTTDLACPGGHNLTLTRISRLDFATCNRCVTRAGAEQELFSCRACDFDLCLSCAHAFVASACTSSSTRCLMATRPNIECKRA